MRYCFKVGWLLIFLISPVYSGVTIQNQGHWVFGQAVSDSYYIEESFPVSGSASDLDAFASSSAGNFSLSALASGDRTRGYISAFAYSGYLFTLDQPFLTIDFDGILDRFESASYLEIAFQLTDLDTQQDIDAQWWNSPLLGTEKSFHESRSYTLSVEHAYSLALVADAGEAGAGKASLQVNLETKPIPVPAPGALLLASVGVGFGAWFSRWRKK